MKTNIKLEHVKRIDETERESVQDVVDKHARRYGILVERLNKPGERGWPDSSYFIENGYVFFIEFKKNSKCYLSKQQKIRRRKMQERGFVVGVCHDAEEGKKFVTLEANKYIKMRDALKAVEHEQ